MVMWTTPIDARSPRLDNAAAGSPTAAGWPESAFRLGLWRYDGEPKPGAIEWMSRMTMPYHNVGKGQTGSGP